MNKNRYITTSIGTECYFFSDTYQDGDSDIISPNSREILQEDKYWQNRFLNFCQFCYIFKLLEGEDSDIKLPSLGECIVTEQSEPAPLKPSNSQSLNNQSSSQSSNSPSCSSQTCRCQPSPKTKAPSHNDDPEIHCQECGQKFAKKKYLKNHVKRFSLTDENRPFKCLFCNHSFMHDKNRKFHERIHNRKLITCCHCSLSFPDLAGARTHIDKEHQNRVYACHECGFNFSNSSHLMRHKREVAKAYPHQCHICGHRYLTAVALSRHETYHLKLKTFKCRVCLKEFSSKVRLQKHLHGQRMEKKYECPCCKVKFLAHKSFKKHEKTFNGDRPFKCNICGHGYNSKPRLTSHMKVHFKEPQPWM